MCNPAIVATGLKAGGDGLAMYGQYQEGKARQQAAEYDADMKDIQAESVADKLSDDLRKKNDQTKITIAKGKAQAAGSGVNVASSNVLDWENDTETAADRDEASLRYNTDLQIWGLKQGAELDRHRGKNARKESQIGMFTTAFGSASSVTSDFASFGTAGS